MRCATCDYPLWNLTTRNCPECGQAFQPSDFEFTPNSVQFCCPHCEQAYYGTTSRGHLHPIEFDCVSCGAHIHMDECVLRPAEGVTDDQTTPVRIPWLDRRKEGRTKAWFRMIGWSLIRPGRSMRGLPLESSQYDAWLFLLITQTIVSLVSTLPALAIVIMMLMTGPPAGRGASAVLATFAGFGLGALVFSLFYAAIWGLATHGLLRLGGVAHGGMGRTMQAICYSSGANICTAVPCFGQYFGWIWWLVSAVLMVKDGQKVSGGRASFAVLTFPVLSILTVVGLYVWLIFYSLNAAGAMMAGQAGNPMVMVEAQAMATALNDWREDNGAWPTHAVELVDDGYLTDEWDYVTSMSMTTPMDVPLGDGGLHEIATANAARRARLVNAAKADLPEDVIAHRLGDFVFTYHGMATPPPDPSLWIVVQIPDPDADPSVASGGSWPQQHMAYAVDANGVVTTFPAANAAMNLAQQNRVRARNGLPMLPDLLTIRHGAPAREGDAPLDPAMEGAIGPMDGAEPPPGEDGGG